MGTSAAQPGRRGRRREAGILPPREPASSRAYNPAMPVARAVVGVALLVATLVPALPAQSPATLRARLSTVPIDVAMQATIAGQGSATATLAGTTLAVEGDYQGLVTPATTVRVYESARRGVRGTLVGEFPSGGGTRGTFKGTVTLTRAQAEAFAKGLLYVQLQSEKAPDGNLWGWLIPPRGTR
jgi:hypothetical protein